VTGRSLTGLVLAAGVWTSVARAQSPPPNPVPLERFPIGETLVYDARFGLLTLGSGLMQISGVDTIRGAPSLHLVFRLQSSSFIYRLDDRMDSWIGLEDFSSRRFIQDFHEGRSDRYTHYEIFPDSGYYIERGVDSVRVTSPLPLDDAAFFYFLRTVDLEVGKRYEFNRYFRPDRNPVILEVLRRDTLDLPAGRFPTLVIRPTIKGRGILAESQDPLMWLSDDERRIMVQLKSTFASIATITLRLRQISAQPLETKP
jgi:hypothetical protein